MPRPPLTAEAKTGNAAIFTQTPTPLAELAVVRQRICHRQPRILGMVAYSYGPSSPAHRLQTMPMISPLRMQ
eukprot:9254684-Heterocapsa_arctica.AAC.1